MTTLYFMRHAQSEANLSDVLASQLDYPLTKQGINEANAIALELKKYQEIDHIISSPLLRAKQTAAPFEGLFNLNAETDSRIIEQNLGIFAGKTYKELENETMYCHDRKLRWDWIPEGNGESYKMIAERLQPFFEMLFQTKHQHILIITHAVTLRLIKSILLNTLPDYPKDIANNGEIWQVKLIKKGEKHIIKSHFFGKSLTENSKA